jgi:hypothetical protein
VPPVVAPANLFIIGLPRAATTMLARSLSQHPDIYLSRIKELNYYGSDIRVRKPKRGFSDYQALLAPGMHMRYRLDASPLYSLSDKVAEEIHADCPDARILIHLRAPREWLKSMYYLYHNLGSERASPDEALRRTPEHFDRAHSRLFMYHDAMFYVNRYKRISSLIEQYRRLFGDVQVHLVFYDDVNKDGHQVCRDITAWLGLDPSLLPPEAGATVVNSIDQRRQLITTMPFWWMWLRAHYKEHFPLYRWCVRPENKAQYMVAKLVKASEALWRPMPGRCVRLYRRLFQSGKKQVHDFTVSPETWAYLAGELNPVVDELSRLSGRNLDHWKISA